MRPSQHGQHGQHNQHNKKPRGRGRKQHNPLSRVYDSNGPDVKIRGTASHVADKYLNLARDANSSGDRIAAESYLQHAEHYLRIIAAAQTQMNVSMSQSGEQPSSDDASSEDGFDQRFAGANDQGGGRDDAGREGEQQAEGRSQRGGRDDAGREGEQQAEGRSQRGGRDDAGREGEQQAEGRSRRGGRRRNGARNAEAGDDAATGDGSAGRAEASGDDGPVQDGNGGEAHSPAEQVNGNGRDESDDETHAGAGSDPDTITA